MCKINCSCTSNEWAIKDLTQTQQELFLTKGSLMVRNKQLEEANIQLAKLQDTLNETEAYCKRKDIIIDLLKQRLETMYE